MILITVEHQSVASVTYDSAVSDSINYLSLKCRFTADWDGLLKTVILTMGEYSVALVLDDNDSYLAERGINLPAGDWEIRIIGDESKENEIIRRITAIGEALHVIDFGMSEGSTPTEISPTYGEQIAAIAYDARAAANSAVEAIEATQASIEATEASLEAAEALREEAESARSTAEAARESAESERDSRLDAAIAAIPERVDSVIDSTIEESLAQAKASGEFDGEPGTDGTDGISAYHQWDGATLIMTSASGTSYADLRGERGLSGLVPEVSVQYAAEIVAAANTMTVIGELAGAIDVTLGEPVHGYSNEWDFVITQGATAYDVVLPEISWGLGIAPTFAASSSTVCRLYYIGGELRGEWSD